jgi:hypothetical protein
VGLIASKLPSILFCTSRNLSAVQSELLLTSCRICFLQAGPEWRLKKERYSPGQDEGLLQRLLVLQEPGEKNGPEVLLELGSFAQEQDVLVVGEVELPASLLVLVPHFIQLPSASASCNNTRFGRIASRLEEQTPIGEAEVQLILISFILTIISTWPP